MNKHPHILSREEFDALRSFSGVPLTDDYPKSTSQAVQELRTRGIATNVDQLDYLAGKGKIHPPRLNGKSREWSAANIDEAAEYLASGNSLTPGAAARAYFNISAYQDELAAREALASAPWLGRNRDLLTKTIHPHFAGLETARIEYRAPTKKEFEALKKSRGVDK